MRYKKIFLLIILFTISCKKQLEEEELKINFQKEAIFVIYDYICGKFSYESTIFNDKFNKDNRGIEYVKLWKELDNCLIDNYDKVFEYLEKNFFDISQIDDEYKKKIKEIEKFKYKVPFGYKSLKKSINEEKEFDIFMRKILKDFLIFKILILKDNKELIKKHFMNLKLEKSHMKKYGNISFYPIFLKLLSNNEISKEEFLIIKNFKNKRSPFYNLLMALYSFKRENDNKFKDYLEIYEKGKTTNLFLNDIYKAFKIVNEETDGKESCYQKKLAYFVKKEKNP